MSLVEDAKISELPLAGTLNGTEQVPMVQDGGTVRVPLTLIAALITANPDVQAMLTALSGQIDLAQLSDALGQRITLVDADATVQGSVAQRIATETQARIDAVQSETDSRVAALSAEAGYRSTGDTNTLAGAKTYTETWSYAKAAVDSAIAASGSSLTTAFQAGDAATLTAANTAISNYAYSKSAVDSAIAAAKSSLTTSFTAADATTLATAEAFTYSRSAIDGAIASASSTLTTNFNAGDAATLSSAKSYTYSQAQITSAIAGSASTLTTSFQAADSATLASAQSYVQTYAYSKAAVDSTIAGLGSSLTTAYQAADATTLSSAKAYTYSQSQITAAIASSATTLTTAYQSADATTLATAQTYVQSYSYSKSAADSAIASSASAVSATLNGNITSAVATEATARATTDNGLLAQYTVKVDTNGYVAGYGLASTLNNGTPSSAFVIRADKFAVSSPSGPGITPATPFYVVTTATTVGGVAIPVGVYMDGAYIASLSVSKLVAGAMTTSQYIRSSAYVAGSAGWTINGDGTAEFAAASVRGKLTAAQINVTSLDALSATIGTLRTASTGARLEIKDNKIGVFDSAGTLRVRIGDLSSAF